MNSLQVYATKTFNGCVLDCYVAPDQQDKGDFWATRAQIGTLLEYEEPMKAVAKIHERNKERLDKFSTVVKLTMVEGGREVTREVMVYNFQGLLAICRFSNQPRADAIMEWLFDVADEIRRTGSYSTKRSRGSLSSFKAAEVLISKAVRCKTKVDRQEVVALDKVFQSNYGYSALDVAEIQLEAPQEAPHMGREAEMWEHIVSTFAPDEWFTSSMLRETLRESISSRQIQRYLSEFVERQLLYRRGYLKNSRYIRHLPL